MKEHIQGASYGPGSRPSDQANLRCPDSSSVDPSRVRKVKGLTRKQTVALFYCGRRWRRPETINAKVFRGRALRPYIEWHAREVGGRFKFSVRLTGDGLSLMETLGIDPPLLRRAEDIWAAVDWADRDSDGSGEAGETRSGSTVGDSAGRQASPNP